MLGVAGVVLKVDEQPAADVCPVVLATGKEPAQYRADCLAGVASQVNALL